MTQHTKQIVLVILDGWGHREEVEHNAIAQASVPFFKHLWSAYPHTLLEASGEAVGLPEGQMGTSEIGHLTLGSGRVRDVDLVRITKAAQANELSSNATLKQLFDHVVRHKSTLHLKGLLSDGGVHSHEDHVYALLKAAKKHGVERVAVHVFTDGRDTPPQRALRHLEALERVMEDVGVGFIASMSGRYYAMDRDSNWDRIARAEDTFYHCKDHVCTRITPLQALEEQYAKGVFDEHIEPMMFVHKNHGVCPISANDGVFFFNFRADRARQLTARALERRQAMNLFVATMTQYDASFDCPVAFLADEYQTTLADMLEAAGLTQTHIAETEKYAHVTYFLMGAGKRCMRGKSLY
jgi:2,3-bisphosphoglycerate-independent phosphoglycerate mutase